MLPLTGTTYKPYPTQERSGQSPTLQQTDKKVCFRQWRDDLRVVRRSCARGALYRGCLLAFVAVAGVAQAAAVCSKMERTDSWSNSPVSKMLRRCLVTAGRLTANTWAICSCVSQTVSRLMQQHRQCSRFGRRKPGAAFVGEAVFLQAAGRFVRDGTFQPTRFHQRFHVRLAEECTVFHPGRRLESFPRFALSRIVISVAAPLGH